MTGSGIAEMRTMRHSRAEKPGIARSGAEALGDVVQIHREASGGTGGWPAATPTARWLGGRSNLIQDRAGCRDAIRDLQESRPREAPKHRGWYVANAKCKRECRQRSARLPTPWRGQVDSELYQRL